MTKLIPAAMTDFKKIIENNYAFVDKTRFLEVYEESGATVSMFLRPRRCYSLLNNAIGILPSDFILCYKEVTGKVLCELYFPFHMAMGRIQGVKASLC